jgi:hypothetical protein
VNPALQVQAATAELASGELELVGHVMHVVEIVAPILVEYVPTRQSVHASLPVILYLPATQAVHVSLAGFDTKLFSCAEAWAKTSFDR